jgi:hypothetical protein
MCIQMLIGQVIPLTVVPPQVIIFYLVILSSLGVARNNLLLPAPILRLSIVLLLTPPLKSSGFVDSYKIWVQLRHPILLYFVTVRVRFNLRTMMYFTSALNILRSTVILCIIIFCRELSTFVLLLLLISWLMCSAKHIHLDVSMILFPNSSWLQHYHLEFVGDVRIYFGIYRIYLIYRI